MEGSRLLDLPPELRNRIYELVLTSRNRIVVRQHCKGSEIRGFTSLADGIETPANCHALLRTCKQVNQEAAQMFWACNEFRVMAGDTESLTGWFYPSFSLSPLHAFIDKVQQHGVKVLGNVTFSLGRISVDVVDYAPGRGLVLDAFRQLRAWEIGRPIEVQVKVDMDLVISLDYSFEEVDTISQKVSLDGLANSATTLQAAIAELGRQANKLYNGKRPSGDDLRCFTSFLQELESELGRGGLPMPRQRRSRVFLCFPHHPHLRILGVNLVQLPKLIPIYFHHPVDNIVTMEKLTAQRNMMKSSTATSIPASPLLRLPGELRTEIYKLVVTIESTIHISHRKADHKLFGVVLDLEPISHNITLLQTCKQIHAEASPLFYTLNTFEIKARNNAGGAHLRNGAELALSTLPMFLAQIGSINAAALRHISFDMGAIRVQDTTAARRRETVLHMVQELESWYIARREWGLKTSMRLLIDREDLDNGMFLMIAPIDLSNVVNSVIDAARSLLEKVKLEAEGERPGQMEGFKMVWFLAKVAIDLLGAERGLGPVL
ncbi:hypothetical protein LTR27_002760 [Elasticomyces elasticus]|nr:hypothetical protein LTR27_002760 [Elasticomyces elasticus]